MIIRPATVDDATGISIVHIDTWKTTYRGMVPDHIIDGMDYVRNNERWRQTIAIQDKNKRTLVAVADDGRVIGFATGGPNRNPKYKFDGEVYAIYILKSYQGSGAGKSLVVETARWLNSFGHKSMIIWVLKDNPARFFYEALSGVYSGIEKVQIGNTSLDEICYGWNDLEEFVRGNS